MAFPSAASARLDYLYHYQAFDPAKPIDTARLGSIIANDAIYFSDPRTFNDPWDCKPWFNADLLANPADLARHIQWYIDISRKHGSGITEAQIQSTAARLKADLHFFRAKIKELSESMGRTIGDQYRVYCLATKPDIELMWAHYASSHHAICLEFSARNATFSTAFQVAYAKDYPIFDITSSDEEHNLLPLIAKSASWAYEEEYRLISQEQATATPHRTIISNNGVAPIPTDALTSIIVGCLADDATIAAITSIVRTSGKPIHIKRAVRAPDQYKLTIAALP
jgi:hypothetical protein